MAELLAPAGSPLPLAAAIKAGADAVYFGSGFNARMRAKNFTEEEIPKAIAFCHKNGVKAYITLNTIIFDSELDAVARYISLLNEYGADAIIVQDLAVAKLAKEIAPEMELHASTQMGVHNSRGAELMKKLGFKRIVLARELTLEEIKEIKKTGIGLEVFVHGALCFGYSGQCSFSYCQTLRSGNRGMCAHMCRFPWKLFCDNRLVKTGYVTSTKDLCTIDKIREIAPFVDGLKIEGRLKNSQYVHDVVSAYRAALDGKPYQLGQAFRGRKFTSGYLFGNPGKNLINKESVDYRGELVGEVISKNGGGQKVKLYSPLSVGESIRTDKSAKAITIYKLFQGKNQVNTAKELCELKIKTLGLGDKIYRVSEIPAEADLNVQASKIRKSNPYTLPRINSSPVPSKGDLYHIHSAEQLKSVPSGAHAIIPLELANEEIIKKAQEKGVKAIVDTPHTAHDFEVPAILEKIEEAKKLSPEAFFVSNLAFLELNYPVYLSYHMNVSNVLAADVYRSIANVQGIVAALEVPSKIAEWDGFYSFTEGKPEVLISEHNIFDDYPMKGYCYLQDPNENKFHLINKNGRTLILGTTLRRAPVTNNYFVYY